MLREHKELLELTYAKYKNFMPVAGSALFCIPQWMQLLKDVGLLGEEETGDFSTREAMMAFFNSRMVVVDEIKNRSKYIGLNFVDFQEALCRVCDMVSLPTDEDLDSVGGVENMLEWNRGKKEVSGADWSEPGDRQQTFRLTQMQAERQGGGEAQGKEGEQRIFGQEQKGPRGKDAEVLGGRVGEHGGGIQWEAATREENYQVGGGVVHGGAAECEAVRGGGGRNLIHTCGSVSRSCRRRSLQNVLHLQKLGRSSVFQKDKIDGF